MRTIAGFRSLYIIVLPNVVQPALEGRLMADVYDLR